MKVSTALNHKHRFLSRVKEIFAIARTSGHNHDEICRRFRFHVSNTAEWKRCPGHVHEYIRGYRDAMFDAIERCDVTWHVWFEGKHVIGKDGVPDGRWAEVDADKGAFIWNRTERIYLGYDPQTEAS